MEFNVETLKKFGNNGKSIEYVFCDKEMPISVLTKDGFINMVRENLDLEVYEKLQERNFYTYKIFESLVEKGDNSNLLYDYWLIDYLLKKGSFSWKDYYNTFFYLIHRNNEIGLSNIDFFAFDFYCIRQFDMKYFTISSLNQFFKRDDYLEIISNRDRKGIYSNNQIQEICLVYENLCDYVSRFKEAHSLFAKLKIESLDDVRKEDVLGIVDMLKFFVEDLDEENAISYLMGYCKKNQENESKIFGESIRKNFSFQSGSKDVLSGKEYYQYSKLLEYYYEKNNMILLREICNEDVFICLYLFTLLGESREVMNRFLKECRDYKLRNFTLESFDYFMSLFRYYQENGEFFGNLELLSSYRDEIVHSCSFKEREEWLDLAKEEVGAMIYFIPFGYSYEYSKISNDLDKEKIQGYVRKLVK